LDFALLAALTSETVGVDMTEAALSEVYFARSLERRVERLD
jgi:hypothetical protein